MNQTYEGTMIGIKPPSNKHNRQECVEQVKASGNHLSGKQPAYQPENQNPEGPTDDGKPSEERRSIVGLWGEMTKLKKGLFIGGIFLTIILVILFTLLIVTIRTKPRLVTRRQEALSVPNSNELLRTYQVQGTKPNIFSPNKNTNFTMTTITKSQATSRLLQEDEAEDPSVSAVILTFDFQNQGVKIRATSADDLMVQIDMDEMLGSLSSNRRLLVQAEMAAALRTLQEDNEQDNALTFSDPNVIRNDALNSLLRAVAKATSDDPQDLEIQQYETVNLLRQSDGEYIVQEEGQSSRLLYALGSLRGLQEWQGVFDEIYEATVVPKIEAVKAAINDLILDDSVDVDNLDVKTALRNSNFASDVAIDVVYEAPEDSQTRLLQEAQDSSTTPGPAPSASLKTEDTPSTSSSSQAPKEKTDSSQKTGTKKKSKSDSDSSSKTQTPKDNKATRRGGKKYGRRPLDKNKRSKSKGKKLRSATTDEVTANVALYCDGGPQNKTCATSVVNNPKSPIKVKNNSSKNQGNQGNQKKSTRRGKPILAIFKKNKNGGDKKRPGKVESKQKPSPSNQNNNLNTEPPKNEKATDKGPKVTPVPRPNPKPINQQPKPSTPATPNPPVIAPPATPTDATPTVPPSSQASPSPQLQAVTP